MRIVLMSIWLLLATLMSASAVQAIPCEDGSAFQHTFDSGANWSFCASIHSQHGLELQQLRYQAPGDQSRLVLKHLHLGQTLLHFHDQTDVQPVIRQQDSENNVSGFGNPIPLSAELCRGTVHSLPAADNSVCDFERPTGLMAKYSMRPGLQGEQYQFFAVFDVNGLTLQTQIGLSEDGRIQPAVELSGNHWARTNSAAFGQLVNGTSLANDDRRFATAVSVLYTWRMVFSLNDAEPNDRVEEFNFVLNTERGNRRPMSVTALETEAFRNIDPDAFRGWRVVEPATGAGYYLDPQNNGIPYRDNTNNWAQFELAVTRYNSCEQHALARLGGVTQSNTSNDNCSGTLDQYVSGESMQAQSPVLWYSQSRVFKPRSEDFPIVSSLKTEFELIPFDWTATSPFEVIGE